MRYMAIGVCLVGDSQLTMESIVTYSMLYSTRLINDYIDVRSKWVLLAVGKLREIDGKRSKTSKTG